MLSGILVIYENMACFIQATVCVQTSNWILRHQFKEEIISTQPFVTQANQQLEANLFFFLLFLLSLEICGLQILIWKAQPSRSNIL